MSDSNQSNETPVILSTPPSSPEPWRAPATGPAWAAGKTPEEILGIAGPAMEMLEKFNLSGRVIGQPSNNPTPQYPQPQLSNGYGQPQYNQPQSPQVPAYDPNDYLTVGQMQAYLQQQGQQYVAPQINSLYESQAATNLQWVQGKDDNKVVFQKYGPEINTLVAQVPPAARTLDNLQLLVDTIAGRHVRELAREYAATLNTTPPTMRSNGVAGLSGAPPVDNGHTLQSESIPQAWKDRALAAGITDTSIREWCGANNQTVEQFYTMLNKSRVVTDAAAVTNRTDENGRVVGREITFG